MSNNTPTIFISGLSLGVGNDDRVVILSLADTLSSENDSIEYRFALPTSIVAKLSNGLNKVCEDLGIDNKNINNETDNED